MKSFRLKMLLCAILVCLVQVSYALVDFRPAQFALKRYRRSRAWPKGRALDPVNEFTQTLDFVALVNQFGYPAEEHLLTTSDGYKLRLHRIPGSPSKPKSQGKPVVYFQHGIFLCSDSWILRGPNKDLAYILADAGYDVWFGNARGNTYSRSHVKYSPDRDAKFWDFSYHEIALYDVSLMIDYVLANTGRERLIYVAHSMGTTMGYVLLSTKPEYNDRIEMMISMAPVAFWHGPPSPIIRFLDKTVEIIKKFVFTVGMYEIFPRTEALIEFIRTTCTPRSVFQPACLNGLYFILGYNPKETDPVMLPYYFSYFLSGASRKTLLHYDQNRRTGNFQMYDYGAEKNLMIYNAKVPPFYDLKKITVPVAIFYGKGDALMTEKDAMELAGKLPNLITVEAVPDEQFSHFDFLYATNLKTLLLDRLMEIITKVTRNENDL